MPGSGYFWLLVGLIGLVMSLAAVYLNGREDHENTDRPGQPGGTVKPEAPHDDPDAG